MKIEAIGGDIAEVAPRLAHVAVLWLRSGFNFRCATWKFKILPNWHPDLRHVAEPPWRLKVDSLIDVHIPESDLKYVYVFSNPTDGRGYASEQEVHDSLWRCLQTVSELGVERIALIHMPLSPDNRHPTRDNNLVSATQMVRTLRTWERDQHPNQFTHVYLVDRNNDFEPIIQPNQ